MDEFSSSHSPRGRLPSLGALRAFEAAARRLSFQRAADELGVTPTAVSHQIRQLEAALGVVLFVRGPRRVSLTGEGAALLPALTRAFDGVAEAIEALRRRPRRRVATLSAAVAFTAKLLVPKTARFRELNPGWDLRLHASEEPVDLAAGEADAAIRYGPDRGDDLVRLPVLTERFAPVASPRFGLTAPEGLRSATLIHVDWRPSALPAPSWTAWAEKAGVKGFDALPDLTFSDETSAILAAVAGQGVALLSLALIETELASGVLTQPFGPTLDGWRFDFVHPRGAENRPAVRALRTWIEEEILRDGAA